MYFLSTLLTTISTFSPLIHFSMTQTRLAISVIQFIATGRVAPVMGYKSYICSWTKKIFESYFRDRLTFSNIDSRTSRRIYRLALLLCAPETLSSLSKSRISIFNAHLTPLVRKMTSHNSIGKYRYLVNWLGICLGTERRRLQTRLVECKTGKKWMSGAPLFTLVILVKVNNIYNIVDVCVEFCWILFYSLTYLL